MEEKPKPPIVGIVYGEAAYWITVLGMIIGIIGAGIYLSGSGLMSPEFMEDLLKGEDHHTLWKKYSEIEELPEGHWYINYITYGDSIAMLGIVICSIAGVIGIWLTTIMTFIKREVPVKFGVFSLVIAVIMTLAALGIVAMH